MKQLNTLPIEDFIEKSRIARKTGQKSLTMTQKEYSDLSDSLGMVMTRLTGKLDQTLSENVMPEKIEIKVDGGRF